MEFHPADKREAKIKLGLNPDEKIVLQLGRMVPRKGVDNVIRSIASLLKIKSIPLKLLIVGGESDEPDPVKTPEIGRLKEIAGAEKIADKVIFAGRKNRQQLIDYYNAADVFVSTPWYEPFGITPLEAMACGTPVIGANVGGIKYSVLHGKTGFLVPPKEPEILGQRILSALCSREVLQELSANALEHVNKYFRWDTVTWQIAELYSQVKKDKKDLTRKIQMVFFRIMDSLRIRNKKMPELK
ncbi:MAG: glycosyltransferase [Cytophagaceae bacterium]